MEGQQGFCLSWRDNMFRCGPASRSCSPGCRGLCSLSPSIFNLSLKWCSLTSNTTWSPLDRARRAHIIPNKTLLSWQIRPGALWVVPQHGQQWHSAAKRGGDQRQHPADHSQHGDELRDNWKPFPVRFQANLLCHSSHQVCLGTSV